MGSAQSTATDITDNSSAADTRTARRPAADEELSQLVEEISPEGQLYYGPNFMIGPSLTTGSQRRPMPPSSMQFSGSNSSISMPANGGNSYETLAQLDDGEDHLLEDLLKTLKYRQELQARRKLPDMQPIETINLDLSVPQEAVELVKSGGDNSCCYELRFQICTRRSCRITLYLQAIENLSKNSAVDNSQHSLLEFQTLGPTQTPIEIQLDGDTCTTHQAALSFRDLKSEWLQPILINDNPGAAKTYSAAAPVIYSMILVAETICSAKDESTFKQQQQQLVTFITTNTQQQNVQIKVTQQKLMHDGHCFIMYDIYGLTDSHGGKSSTAPSISSLNSIDKSFAIAASAAGASPVSQRFLSPDCVICMSEVKNTLALPCRHLCLCAECAEVLRHQNNKCPICRQNFHSLLQLKIS